MLNYAIVVVPPDWDSQQAIGFSSAAYDQWHDQIEAGMRVLIFKAPPLNALAGEGESLGVFAKLADWPDVNVSSPPKTAFGARASYVMPLSMLYMWAEAKQIPLEQVRERITDPDFP